MNRSLKKSQKVYSVLNIIVLSGVIFWNYWVNTKGIDGNTISTVSQQYSNLFTPAGYAFSIWGVIFISLFAQAIFFIRCAFNETEKSDFIDQIGPFLILANIGNGLWVYFWVRHMTGISVLIMLGILLSLFLIIIRTNMERWDAPRKIIFWLWWPICIYSGWIAVASLANISAFLVKIEWDRLGISELNRTIALIIVAVLLNIFMVYSRNMREFALVGVWSLVAIAIRHWGDYPSLHYTAMAGALLILNIVGVHAYKNRHFSPFRKRTLNQS